MPKLKVKSSRKMKGVVDPDSSLIEAKRKVSSKIFSSDIEQYKIIILNKNNTLNVVDTNGTLSIIPGVSSVCTGYYKDYKENIEDYLIDAIEMSGANKRDIKTRFDVLINNAILDKDKLISLGEDFDALMKEGEVDLDVKVPGLSVILKNYIIDWAERVSDYISYENWIVIEEG